MSSHKFLIRLAALLGLTFLVGCGVSTVTIEEFSDTQYQQAAFECCGLLR